MKNFLLFTTSKASPYSSLKWLAALLFIGLLPASTQAQTITGTVFRDFNTSGAKDNTASLNEVGVGGVRVSAYTTTGAFSTSVLSSTATATLGQYSLNVGNTNAYRIEFTNLPSGDFDAFRGAGSGTSVQFANGNSSGVNLGINYPTDYCQANPELVTSCYVFGDQQSVSGVATTVGIYGNDPVLISFPYTAGSRTIQDLTGAGGVYDQPTAHRVMILAKQVGTTLGLAYARKTKKLYSAAFFKKHAGFGPGGPGAIYVSDANSTSTVSTTITVPGATTNAHNTADYNRDNDNVAWDAVGKTSLGGMDLSDDEDTLYVMNLQNRTLYALNPTSGSVFSNQAVSLTLPGCPTAGDVRPFAVEYHRGKVYVGIVCSAESSNSAANLKAYVYTVNPATLAFATTPAFQMNLNYPRGKAASTGPADWLPWKNSYTNISTNQATRLVYPMPMFTNIAFDNGDLIIGLRDRIGDIAGNQAKDNPATQDLYQGRVAGDILRAGGSPETGWTLEDNGRSEGNGTAVQNTGQGPGTVGAEFYHGDAYPIATGGVVSGVITGTTGIGVNHDEVSSGTMTQIPGFVEVAAVVFDPVIDNDSDGFFDGGVRWLNNITGAWEQSYRVYNGDGTASTDFGKAAGLGELIPFCNLAPIQIGNRVWNDINNNGIQDAGEPALSGVVVQLKGPGVPANTTATTNSSGEYYFSNGSGTAETGFVYSLTGLTSGGSYSLCFPLSASAGALSLSSKANSATGTNADNIDTDASSAGIIAFTLGSSGQNNFSYDAAYLPSPPCALTLTATPGTCQSATNQYAVSGTLNFTSVPAGTLTLTDQSNSTPTRSVTLGVPAGTTALAYSLSGIGSGGRIHTITATFSNTACAPKSLTYLSPVSCTAAPCIGNNLLLNPSFEQGFPVPPNGQQFQVPPPSWVGGTADNNPQAFSAPDGYAFAFSGDNGGTLCQSVSATAGSNHSLVFYAGVHVANGQTVRLSFLNSSSAVIGTPRSFTSTYILESTNSFGGPYSLSGVAPTGTTQVRVCAVSGNGTGFNFWSKVDNLCLTGTTPPCGLSVAVNTPICNTATNQYTATGTVSLSNTPAGSLTITDNGVTVGVVSVTAGQASATFSVSGISNASSHTLAVRSSNATCGTASRTYSAPASCSVAPCGLSLTVTPGLCQSATNRYTLSMQVTATNVPGSGTLTTSSLAFSPAFIQTLPVGNSSGSLSFSGLVSNGQVFTVTSAFSNTACASVSQTFTAPVSCSVARVCSLTATPTAGLCQTATNTYSSTVVVLIANTGAGGVLTITDGSLSQTLAVGSGFNSFTGTAIFNNVPSNGQGHNITASLPGCSSTTGGYTAPASCSVALPCSVMLAVTAGICSTVTNTYSATAMLQMANVVTPQTVTITMGGVSSAPVSLSAGNNSITFVATGLTSDGLSKLATATFSGTACASASATYAAPASCTVCSLSLTSSMLANGQVGTAYSQTLTTTGGTAPVSYSVSAGSLPTGLSLNGTTGVISGTPTSATPASFTVSVTDAKNCSAVAPLTITTSAQPVCSLTATATPTTCNTATGTPTANQYTVTGTISATNTTGNQSLTVSVGSINMVVALTGNGPVSYTLSGLTSDGLVKTVSVVSSATDCGMTSVTYTAPASCTVAPPTASLGDFVFDDVNKDGIQDVGDLPISGAIVTLLQNGSAVATTTTSVSGLYSFTGLTPGIPYSVSFTTPTGFSVSTSANVGSNDGLDNDAINGLTGPYTLTAGENNPTVDAGFVRPAPPTPSFILAKLVSASKAKLGDVISYTIVLINTGPVAATSVVVNDTFTGGLSLVPGSLTISNGSYTPGLQGGTWAIASLPVGATATLTYAASITAEGVIYNTASLPGDEAQVCTTVPFAVCKDTPFAIELAVPTGFSRYQWYHTAPGSATATLLSDGTLNSFTATLPGEYKVIVDQGLSGRCAQLACCPILIEEIEVPRYTAQGKNPTCIGTTPQSNGEITLLNLGVDPTVYFYQISAGTSFSASTAIPAQPTPVPANGIVRTGLADGTYSIRVWVLVDGQPSCPRDVTVTLTANCACPEEVCVPVTIRKVKRQ